MATSKTAPAPAPADEPAVDNGTEREQLEAAAAGLAAEGRLGGSGGGADVPADDDEGRQRAMRQKDPDAYAKRVREENDLVQVRVTKKGDAKISRGQHYGGIGDDHYETGDEFPMPRTTALVAEERGFVTLL